MAAVRRDEKVAARRRGGITKKLFVGMLFSVLVGMFFGMLRNVLSSRLFSMLSGMYYACSQGEARDRRGSPARYLFTVLHAVLVIVEVGQEDLDL